MVSSLLLLVTIALAEDFKQVQQGQPAPFAGTLIRPEALATILSQNDSDIATCAANAQHSLEKEQIKCDFNIQKLQYEVDSSKETNKAIMQEKQKELDKTYELLKKQNKNLTPLWIGIGFLAGTVSAYGAFYAYNHI